jgi:hypothetical protein
VRHHYREAWKKAKDVDRFLLRSLLAGAFSGTPDQLIDDLVGRIKQLQNFDADELFEIIRSKGRSLELTEDRFWQMGYGSDTVHLLFNLWYRSFNYTPAYENNLPQVDHIFPQSVLRKVKMANPRTGRSDLMKYKEAERNQLANCMLLTQQENGAGGKSDTLPELWFAEKDETYLDMHMIPHDRSLWPIDRYEEFIEERKSIILDRFSYLLSSPSKFTADSRESGNASGDNSGG